MNKAASPEQMTRDQLVERVKQLEQEVDLLDSNAARETQLNIILSRLIGEDFDDYSNSVMDHSPKVEAFAQRFEEMDKRLRKLEEIADTERSLSGDKDLEDWDRVLQKADDLKDHQDHNAQGSNVKLFKHQVANALDISDRWARKRMKQEFAGKEGVEFKDYQANGNAGKPRPMALYIDLDFWEVPE